jgi:STE24 endopeptidase
VVMFAMLYWLTPRIVARYGTRWGIRSISDPAVIPIYSILIALFFFCATPLINTLIRVHESEADAFALESAREPDAQSRAFLKLAEYRKMQPGPIEEMLFFDHPSGQTRIRMAMAWKAKHLAEVEARGK